MLTLQDALANAAAGWNMKHEIASRGIVVRSHAQRGNFARAEEIACEVDALQKAVLLRDNPRATWIADREDCDVWSLDIAFWGDLVTHAVRVPRYFDMPFGSTIEAAEAEARRRLHAGHFIPVQRIGQQLGRAA